MRSRTLPTSRIASAAVGSSMITTRPSKAVARAIATAWACPPESSSTPWSTDLTVMLSRSRWSIAIRRDSFSSTTVKPRTLRPGSRPR